MPPHERDDGAEGRLGTGLAPVEHLRQLAEEPGSPQAPAPDDHAVAAGLAHHAQRVPALPDVAVPEHRDRDRALERGDGAPVGGTGVELGGGARMEADRRGALGFGDPPGV